MRPIDPKHFNKIMSLPVDERTDLLEFLGATHVPTAQIDRLISQVSSTYKRQAQGMGDSRRSSAI